MPCAGGGDCGSLVYYCGMGAADKKYSVLLIEDDQLLSDLLARKFGAEKIPATYAPTGEIALEMLENKRVEPDLILLDIRLPGIDGFEVLKKIKANADLSKIPVIILSNFGQPEDVAKGKELGAEEFIVKVTLTLDQIIDIVHKSFDKFKADS